MPLNLANSFLEFLQQNPEQKFTAREIATWRLKTYLDECRQKQECSKNAQRQRQFRIKRLFCGRNCFQEATIRETEAKTTEGRPRKYYFTKVSDDAEVANIESDSAALASKNNNWVEHNLYLVLSEFLW